MRETELQGKTALVTGASSGLGEALARQLAAAGCHLILVARRQAALATLKHELESRHGVCVYPMPMDLTAPDAPRRLYDQVQAAGLAVDVLVNNAGLGLYGTFAEIPWEREKPMLELDMLTVVHLIKLFVPEMVSRKFGLVLNIASTGAFQPTPTFASYAAAKSFVLSYSEAVNRELCGTGVKCTALCPGFTRTEFFQVSGQKKLTLYQRLTMMSSVEVARIGIRALLGGRSSVVAGWINVLVAGFVGCLPRSWAAAVAQRAMNL
jgi:uncharacterized protein